MLKDRRLINSTILTTNRSNGSHSCRIPSPQPVSASQSNIRQLGDIEVLTCCRYNTTSNRTRIIKTPGGDTRILHIKKRGTAPKCGDCGVKLPGVSTLSFSTLAGLDGRLVMDGQRGATQRPGDGKSQSKNPKLNTLSKRQSISDVECVSKLKGLSERRSI